MQTFIYCIFNHISTNKFQQFAFLISKCGFSCLLYSDNYSPHKECHIGKEPCNIQSSEASSCMLLSVSTCIINPACWGGGAIMGLNMVWKIITCKVQSCSWLCCVDCVLLCPHEAPLKSMGLLSCWYRSTSLRMLLNQDQCAYHPADQAHNDCMLLNGKLKKSCTLVTQVWVKSCHSRGRKC